MRKKRQKPVCPSVHSSCTQSTNLQRTAAAAAAAAAAAGVSQNRYACGLRVCAEMILNYEK